MEHAAQSENSRQTSLTEFFQYNSMHPTCPCPDELSCECNIGLKYQDFVEKFVLHKRSKQDGGGKYWAPRQRRSATIGRLVMLHPSKGDVFYLRMLLTHDHCKGKRSYEVHLIIISPATTPQPCTHLRTSSTKPCLPGITHSRWPAATYIPSCVCTPRTAAGRLRVGEGDAGCRGIPDASCSASALHFDPAVL